MEETVSGVLWGGGGGREMLGGRVVWEYIEGNYVASTVSTK